MFSNIGSGEVIVVVIVLIFLFGGKKLPELARGLGESSKEIRKIKKEVEGTLSDLKGENALSGESAEEKSKGGETGNA